MRRLLPLLLLASLAVGCKRTPPEKPTSETSATAEPTPSPKAVCCAECTDAASKDPSARDLEMVACGDYAGRVVNGAPALSDACVAWFREHPTTVGVCRDAR